MKCKHCEDPINDFMCQGCKNTVGDECQECHAEVVHGSIEIDTNVPLCGNPTPYTEDDAQYFPTIPWIKKPQ